jgi:periplasmic divalent cation tolerance protein
VAADLVLVLTTLAAGTDGLAFARTLVEERLAACVNVWPAMTSIYRWKGAIEQDLEQQLVIKTTAVCVPALRDRFRTLHPYETPEFIVLTADDAAAAYLAWARESTTLA